MKNITYSVQIRIKHFSLFLFIIGLSTLIAYSASVRNKWFGFGFEFSKNIPSLGTTIRITSPALYADLELPKNKAENFLNYPGFMSLKSNSFNPPENITIVVFPHDTVIELKWMYFLMKDIISFKTFADKDWHAYDKNKINILNDKIIFYPNQERASITLSLKNLGLLFNFQEFALFFSLSFIFFSLLYSVLRKRMEPFFVFSICGILGLIIAQSVYYCSLYSYSASGNYFSSATHDPFIGEPPPVWLYQGAISSSSDGKNITGGDSLSMIANTYIFNGGRTYVRMSGYLNRPFTALFWAPIINIFNVYFIALFWNILFWICSALSIYYLGAKLTSNKYIGIASALQLALSPVYTFYIGFTAQYVLAISSWVIVPAVLLLTKVAEKEGSKTIAFCIGSLMGCLALTYEITALIAAVFFFFLLKRRMLNGFLYLIPAILIPYFYIHYLLIGYYKASWDNLNMPYDIIGFFIDMLNKNGCFFTLNHLMDSLFISIYRFSMAFYFFPVLFSILGFLYFYKYLYRTKNKFYKFDKNVFYLLTFLFSFAFIAGFFLENFIKSVPYIARQSKFFYNCYPAIIVFSSLFFYHFFHLISKNKFISYLFLLIVFALLFYIANAYFFGNAHINNLLYNSENLVNQIL